MPELEIGRKIKRRYEILEEKGTCVLGATIYLGRDSETGGDVIIRILPSGASNDPEAIARFIQSAELAKKLSHPNILPLLDAGEDEGLKFLVSKHEKGFFLDEYLEHRGRLDELESARLVKSICSALEYAWNVLKIIHRNICPGTIFVGKGNVPMLTDFDLAKSLESDSKLTVDGFTVGDPLYMSPEQARGAAVDFRSDMYCVGLVFFHLLTGAPLFKGRDKMDILRAQVSETHPPVKSLNPDLSDSCSAVLDKLLAKRPEDRYQSWSDALNALEAVARPGISGKQDDMSTSRYKMQAISMPAAGDSATASASEKSTDAVAKSKAPMAAVAVLLVLALIGAALSAFLKNGGTGESVAAPVPLLEKESPAKSASEIIASTKLAFPKSTANSSASVVKSETTSMNPAKVAKPVEPVKVASAAKTAAEFGEAKEARNRKACANNLKQIGVALLMYANVFQTKFPEKNGAAGLDELRKNGFVELPQIFVCPSTEHVAAAPNTPITEETCDYVYIGGLSSEHSNPKTPIAWSKPGNHKDFGCVLFVNGEVKCFSGSNWLEHTKPPKD